MKVCRLESAEAAARKVTTPVGDTVTVPLAGGVTMDTLSGTMRAPPNAMSFCVTAMSMLWPAKTWAASGSATGGWCVPPLPAPPPDPPLWPLGTLLSPIRKCSRPKLSTYSTPDQRGRGAGISLNWPGNSTSQRISMAVSSWVVLWQCST